MKCANCGAEVKTIPLTKGKVAIVPADFEGGKYYAKSDRNGKIYAGRMSPNVNGKKSTFYIHQDLMYWKSGDNKGPNGWTVDHVDRNPLNNCRCNLRRATLKLQSHNQRPRGTSKYKGVNWYKRHKKWHAQIWDGQEKRLHLGYFDSEHDAACAFNAAALRIYGPDAFQNVIEEKEAAE